MSLRRSSLFVPGSRSPPILQRRTHISSQLRPFRTVSLSGFLTCQSLHTISILSSINHSVVSLTCCLPRLCCDSLETLVTRPDASNRLSHVTWVFRITLRSSVSKHLHFGISTPCRNVSFASAIPSLELYQCLDCLLCLTSCLF